MITDEWGLTPRDPISFSYFMDLADLLNSLV